MFKIDGNVFVGKTYSNNDCTFSSSIFKVLGYLNRNALDTKNLIKEIKAIASIPTERYFFNVSDEAALLEKAGTLGEQIFSIEGKKKKNKKQNSFQEFSFKMFK